MTSGTPHRGIASACLVAHLMFGAAAGGADFIACTGPSGETEIEMVRSFQQGSCMPCDEPENSDDVRFSSSAAIDRAPPCEDTPLALSVPQYFSPGSQKSVAQAAVPAFSLRLHSVIDPPNRIIAWRSPPPARTELPAPPEALRGVVLLI